MQFDVPAWQETMSGFDEGSVGGNVDERGIMTGANADHYDAMLDGEPRACCAATLDYGSDNGIH
jgi:hypothetical protein